MFALLDIAWLWTWIWITWEPVSKRVILPQPKEHTSKQLQLLPLSRGRGCHRPGSNKSPQDKHFFGRVHCYQWSESCQNWILNVLSQDSLSPTTVSSPSSRHVSHIIGAEDDYFDSDQEQVFYHRAMLTSAFYYATKHNRYTCIFCTSAVLYVAPWSSRNVVSFHCTTCTCWNDKKKPLNLEQVFFVLHIT